MKSLLLLLGLMFFVTISSAHAIELKLGEKTNHDLLDLLFYDVDDSRCPLDVTCVWEGKVTATILVQNQTHKISKSFDIDSTLSAISPYNVTLVDVIPHPTSTEKPDYVAILDITTFSQPIIQDNQVQIASPLNQFNHGIPYHEIKCNDGLQLTQKYDGTPACVNSETVFELIKRDWVSDIIRLVQSRDVSLDPEEATSSYMDKVVPTLDDFKNTLSGPYDIDTIFFKFGPPHDDIGSGIHIYVYDLNDSNQIWIGFTDHILYVRYVDSDGNLLEQLF
jgi:hypothetical protein